MYRIPVKAGWSQTRGSSCSGVSVRSCGSWLGGQSKPGGRMCVVSPRPTRPNSAFSGSIRQLVSRHLHSDGRADLAQRGRRMTTRPTDPETIRAGRRTILQRMCILLPFIDFLRTGCASIGRGIMKALLWGEPQQATISTGEFIDA